MLRVVLALLASLLPSLAVAQQADEPVIITGVIRDLNGVTFPYGNRDYHSQSARLTAWREGDGPVRTVQLWVSFKTGTYEEMQAFEKQFRRNTIVRFETVGSVTFRGDTGKPRSAEVVLARLLEPVEDAEVFAAAQSLLNPVAFEDPVFGTFEPHSSIPEFFGQIREWLGQETVFEVILEPLGPEAREAALSMARIAWDNREVIDAEIREAVTEAVYGERPADIQIAKVTADGATTSVDGVDEGPRLTRDAFRTDHRLKRVSCSAQGYCDFRYEVQNDEWFWSYRATIMRSDAGSWHLDGWDFP